jgi:hypothetical protein
MCLCDWKYDKGVWNFGVKCSSASWETNILLLPKETYQTQNRLIECKQLHHSLHGQIRKRKKRTPCASKAKTIYFAKYLQVLKTRSKANFEIDKISIQIHRYK